MKRNGRGSNIDVVTTGGRRRLRLSLDAAAPSALVRAAMRYFDDDALAVKGLVVELPAFIERARKLDPSFVCTPQALNFILEQRDRQRRHILADGLSDSEIKAVVKAPLLPYQVEGARFAFRAGRAVLADDPGLGKVAQALAAAELFKARNMASRVLVVCPTSLKYQWAKEIERLTACRPQLVEGPHEIRRGLYGLAASYTIVSYHTLANDIKALGMLHSDIVIFDQAQRLSAWNQHIAAAARRVDADFALALAPVRGNDTAIDAACALVDSESVSDPAARAHICLARSSAEIASQLPPVLAKSIFVPMTKEQRAIHDRCRDDVAAIASKWTTLRFLSEKERKRFLLSLDSMRMSCTSTLLIDSRQRSDTKIAECLQYVADNIAAGTTNIIVFTHWEAVASILRHAFQGQDCADKATVVCDSALTHCPILPSGLVIHIDNPWDDNTMKHRMSRTSLLPHAAVVSLVSASTAEEVFHAGECSLACGLDIDLDRLTMSDSRLDEITTALSPLFKNDNAEKGTLVSRNEQESMADDAESTIPEAEKLLDAAAALIDGVSRIMGSKEAAARLNAVIAKSTDKPAQALLAFIAAMSRQQ